MAQPLLPMLQFSVDDLEDPGGIERVLQQIQTQLQQIQQSVPAPPDVNALANQIWQIIQQPLQALVQQQVQTALRPATPARS